MHHQHRPILALGLRLAAALLMATLMMLVKMASESGIALPEIMFWRQAVTVPVLLGWLWFHGEVRRLRTDRLGGHGLRAVTGMCGMVCGFGAATLLPLAEATTIGFTTPLFAVILTGLVLRDHVGPWRWLSVVLGFIGVLVITQPGQQPIPVMGASIGLAGAFLVAIISFQMRDLGRTEEPLRITFWFAAFGAPLMALFLPFFMTAHTAEQWLLLLALGLVGTVGQIFLAASLRFGVVASVLVMDYTALIWATVYGWLVWDHLPPTSTWLGAPLIIAAGLVIAWREHRLSRIPSPLGATDVE